MEEAQKILHSALIWISGVMCRLFLAAFTSWVVKEVLTGICHLRKDLSDKIVVIAGRGYHNLSLNIKAELEMLSAKVTILDYEEETSDLRDCLAKFAREVDKIDVLICLEEESTNQETFLDRNFLRHFAICQALMPVLTKTAELSGKSRIILPINSICSSVLKPEDVEAPDFFAHIAGHWSYLRSHLASKLYLQRLSKMWKRPGVEVVVAHSDWISKVGYPLPDWRLRALMDILGKFLAKTPFQAAQNFVLLVQIDENINGKSYFNCKEISFGRNFIGHAYLEEHLYTKSVQHLNFEPDI